MDPGYVTRPRIPHKVKPNEKELVPHNFAAATITPEHEVRDTDVCRTWGGCALVTWRDATWPDRDPKWFTPATPLQLWRDLTAAVRTKARLWVFVHGLTDFMLLADGLNLMPQLGWDMTRFVGGESIARVDFRKGNYGMVLVDVQTYWPHALSVIEQTLGRACGKLPDTNPDLTAREVSAKHDTDVIRQAVTEFVGWWAEQGLGNFQPSGAALGWSLWRHRFYQHSLFVHNDEETLRVERRSTYTGRCEALIKGRDMAGPWFLWDMQAAYPRVAAQVMLPYRLSFQGAKLLPWFFETGQYSTRWMARCRVETDVPIVPFRDSRGVCWPVGTFTSTLWDVEVRMAEKAGAMVAPEYWWGYSQAPLLKAWAEWSLDRIAAGDGAGPGPTRLWIKHQSRAVIGRFAMTYAPWRALAYTGDHRPSAMRSIDRDTGDLGWMFTVNGIEYDATQAVDGQDTFPAVMAVVMAEGRVRMQAALTACPEGTVAYCDTDGLWATQEGSRAMEAHAQQNPGHGWRLKETSTRLTVLGPQSVISDDDRKMSGLPRGATLGSNGKWIGQRKEGALMALQRSGGGSVLDRLCEWSGDRLDTRRQADGKPIVVHNGIRVEA